MSFRLTLTVGTLFILLGLSGCGGGQGMPEVDERADAASASMASAPQVISINPVAPTLFAFAKTDDAGLAVARVEHDGEGSRIVLTPGNSAGDAPLESRIELTVCEDPACDRKVRSERYSAMVTGAPKLSLKPAALSLHTDENGPVAVGTIRVKLPKMAGVLTSSVSPSNSSWLSTSVVGSDVIVSASPAGMPKAVLVGQLRIDFVPTTGAAVGLVVPVTFSVGRGFFPPPAQQITLNAGTVPAHLSRAVQVLRIDGVKSKWTAVSSQPWLAMARPSGSTPGTIVLSVVPAVAAQLANDMDHTAIVTLSAVNVPPATIAVTFQKRLPYLSDVLPATVTAGEATRVVLRGRGFTQYADITPWLAASGLAVSDVEVRSDTEMAITVRPSSVGTQVLRLGNTAGMSTSTATLTVLPAPEFIASSIDHVGEKRNIAYDPRRKAFFALDWLENALVRYRYSAGTWSVAAIPIYRPWNVAVAPDGRRVLVTTSTDVIAVDPDTMQIVASYASPSGISQSYDEPLAISSNGRLWLPSSSFDGSWLYFNLATNTFQRLPNTGAGYMESAAFIGSADGSTVLASPDHCCSPRGRWSMYSSPSEQISRPPLDVEFWYDPRLSSDGSRILKQSGELFTRTFQFLGQLPTPAASDFIARVSLSPNGTRIFALVSNGSATQFRLDVYSTTHLEPGTVHFSRIASVPLPERSADCGFSYPYGCNPVGKLLSPVDDHTVFWIGNRKLQVIVLR